MAAGDAVEQKAVTPPRVALVPGDAVEQKAAIPQQVALVAGDVIEVKFFYTPELNETQTVRPDGKIMLQLVGEVKVEGKTRRSRERGHRTDRPPQYREI